MQRLPHPRYAQLVAICRAVDIEIIGQQIDGAQYQRPIFIALPHFALNDGSVVDGRDHQTRHCLTRQSILVRDGVPKAGGAMIVLIGNKKDFTLAVCAAAQEHLTVYRVKHGRDTQRLLTRVRGSIDRNIVVQQYGLRQA